MEAVCHKYSLNALGKRAKNLDLNGEEVKHLHQYVQEWAKKEKKRDLMNFSFSGNLFDTSEKSIKAAKTTFKKLYEKGYSYREGNQFYLDVKKISSDFDLESIIQEIKFFSDRSRIEFLRILNQAGEAVRISKKRKYAISNPLGGDPISPIFGVANLWRGYYDGIVDLFSAGEKGLTRYLMLRFLSQVSISDELPMKSILIYNYIDPEGGFDSWKVEDIIGNKVDSDSLRYGFAKSFSLTEQKTKLKKSLINGGRKFVYKIGNLKNFWLKKGFKHKKISLSNEDKYRRNMKNFKYSKVLEDLELALKKISQKINQFKKEDKKTDVLFEKYLILVEKSKPFCPFICNKVVKDLTPPI